MNEPGESVSEEKQVRPSQTLLEAGGIPVYELATLASREGRRPRPIYTAHKWFARRLGCVFRSLLVAATSNPDVDFWSEFYGNADLRGKAVLDPFVGGGTSVVEATRLGANTTGVDIDPVACVVTDFELRASQVPDLLQALHELQTTVGEAVRRFHVTKDEEGNDKTVLHHFWVQVVRCEDCGFTFDAHPTFVLSQFNGRRWVICSSCGSIEERKAGAERVRCSQCRSMTVASQGRVKYGKARCPNCGVERPLIELGRKTQRPPEYRLFALEILDQKDGGRPVPISRRRFLAATDADRVLYDEASSLCQHRRRTHPETFPEATAFQQGRTDPRLLAYGYREWTDLFNPRQLLHLSLLAEALSGYPEHVRRPLSISLSDHLTTNCMMASYAAGWRRLAPLFSVRAFRHITRPVELNPWCDGTGRGTYPNAVRKVLRAVDFIRSPKEPMVTGNFKSVPTRKAMKAPVVVNGTAEDMSFVKDASVDVVLTDPPYFDNIAYSELAEFFVPWMKLVGLLNGDTSRRAVSMGSLVANRNDSRGNGRYKEGLARAFSEVERVLRPDGLVVFTYRHALPEAWLTLAEAIASTGLQTVAYLPMPGEAGVGPHAHRGTGLWDAVLVLRRADKHRGEATAVLALSQSQIDQTTERVRVLSGQLSSAKIPFHAVDRMTLCRAGFVAAATGPVLQPIASHDRTELRNLLWNMPDTTCGGVQCHS